MGGLLTKSICEFYLNYAQREELAEISFSSLMWRNLKSMGGGEDFIFKK